MACEIRTAGDHGHVPVLLDRCVELLTPALTRQNADGAGAVLVDATLGAGGHAERFLTELPGLRLIGLDRDPDALWIAGERLAPFGDRVMLVRTRYDGIESVLAESGYWTSQVDRRHPVRPRRLVDAAGPHRARLLLLRRRATGHADGSRMRR